MSEMNPTPEEIRRMQEEVEAARSEEEQALEGNMPAVGPGDSDTIDTEFVEKCFRANEVGDSVLYSRLHRDKYACNDTSEDWLYYVGPHWEVDKMKRRSLAAIEDIVDLYIEHLLIPTREKIAEYDLQDKDEKKEAAPLIRKKNSVQDRIDRLRSYNGRNAMLKCSATNTDPLFLTPDQLDQNRLLFPCKNGVFDLERKEFRDGRPGDYLTSCSPFDFDGLDSPCPAYERFIYEVTGENEQDLDCIHRHLGYSATGLSTERMFMVFHGPHGQNGKGTLFNLLNKILGSMAGSIPTEMLMKQRAVKSASGPSPELLDLKGKRMVWASETEDNQSFANGLIKRFSGGDEVVGRGIHEKYVTRFYPTHTLALICNNLPYAPAGDNAFWSRIRVFRFPHSYQSADRCTEKYHRVVDGDLEEKLLQEAPGIIAWLIRGYYRYLEDGIKLSPNVEKWSKEYRDNEDELQKFIDQHCAVDFEDPSPGNRESASSLYAKFKEWWEENHSNRPPGNKKFSDQMVYKGHTKIKSGGMYYQYIRLQIQAGGE